MELPDGGFSGLGTKFSVDLAYRTLAPAVRAELRRLGARPSDLDDLMQDVFFVLFRRGSELESLEDSKRWLKAVAQRVYWGYRRSRRRRDHLSLEWAPPSMLADTGYAQPERQVAVAHALRRVDFKLRKLRRNEHDVFMCVLEGCAAPEIATRLGLSVNAVYRHLRAARLRLAREKAHRVAQL